MLIQQNMSFMPIFFRYDLKLMREYIVPALVEMDPPNFIVKKGTGYNYCISTANFKFLDLCYYLSPGVSLDGFLKAYGTTLSKSYFPFEYFSSLNVLEETEFPSYEAFYSSLKQRNTLEPTMVGCLSDEERELVHIRPGLSIKTPLESSARQTVGRHRYQVSDVI